MLWLILHIQLLYENDDAIEIIRLLGDVTDETAHSEILLRYEVDDDEGVGKTDVTDEADEDDEWTAFDDADAERLYGT